MQKALLHRRQLYCTTEGFTAGRKFYCTVESFTAKQKVLLRSRQLYCIAEGFTARQKVLLHGRKLYCIIESLTAQQKILLHSRKFYRTVEKSILWQNWRKVPSVVGTIDKPTLQRLPLDLDSTFAHKLAVVLWSPFRSAPDPTSFLEKA